VYGNTAFGTVTCHLLLPDIHESLAIKTADTRDATPRFRAAYCFEHHGGSTRTYGLTSQNTAQLTMPATLRYCAFKHRDLEQLSTRIMKARNTLSTRLQDTNHRKQNSSNYFVLATQTYCLSKSKQVFKLALVGYKTSIVRLDSITLTDSILPEVELNM